MTKSSTHIFTQGHPRYLCGLHALITHLERHKSRGKTQAQPRGQEWGRTRGPQPPGHNPLSDQASHIKFFFC